MTFVRGQPKPPSGGRRKGTPNKGTERARRLIAEGDDREIVAKVIAGAKAGDPEARRIYFRHLRPPPPSPAPEATFAPAPFDLRAMATLKDASEELLRIAGAVAAGELDHGTGQFLITIIKAFAETLTGVKTEREIAIADGLKPGGGA
jgi:hypothetical protein